MKVEFDDKNLERVARDRTYDMGLPAGLVKAFRMRVQLVEAAIDTRALYALTSLHLEKLKGNLQGRYSMRLNKQWRLLLRMEERADGKVVVFISIVDYH